MHSFWCYHHIALLGQPIDTDCEVEGRVLILSRDRAPQLVVHAASCLMHTRILSQELNLLGYEPEHSFPCSVEVKNRRKLASFPLNSRYDTGIFAFLSLSSRMTKCKL
jgi:tRNA U34 2-thiouridine synthase MnmA/TrmU